MSRRSRNSVLRFQDALNRLENRRLLAVAFANVDPILKSGDFTGPTSSVGPDGNTDIKISLKDLTAKEVASVLVTAKFSDNSFTYWKYGDNKQGLPYAEFIRQLDTDDTYFPISVDGTGLGYTTATIYVSPTGGLAIKEITVSVTYINESGTSTETTTPFNTTSLSDLNSIVAETRSKVESLPTYLANAAEFQTNQFNGTEFSTVKKGDFLIKLTSLPSGKSYSDIEAIYLDDGTGAAQGNETKPTIGYGSAVWSSVYGQGSYRLTIDKKSTYADIYAQPIRNELGSTMTMVVKLTGNPVTYFYTQFEGKAVDETLAGRSNAAWVDGTAATYYVQPMNGTSVGNGAKVTVRTGTTGNFLGDPLHNNDPYDLKYLLSSAGSGVIPTGSRVIFTAASGANEYVIPQSPYSGNHALVLDRSISLEGESGATLKIDAETTIYSETVEGKTVQKIVTYDDSILISSSHVQIKGLKIDFDKKVYHDVDKENSSLNARAVIGILSPTAESAAFKSQLVNVRLVGNEIVGPYTTTGNPSTLSTVPAGTVGIRQDSPLIRTRYASGLIDGNIIRGGTVDLELGPWTVVKNSFQGPKGTLISIENSSTKVPAYVVDLIKLTSARDVVVENNEAKMPVGTGNQKQQRAYRFVLMKNDLGAATNLRIEGNTIGSGVGRRMDDSTDQTFTGTVNPGTFTNLQNLPEIILSENYGMNYEGKTLQISTDRRILQLPSPDTSRRGWSIKAGDVVAILEGPFAGQFRIVAQVFLPGGVTHGTWKSTSTVLILQDPLPGTETSMVVSVTQGTKNLKVVENSIDLKDTTSHAIVLSGNEYDVLVKGNTIEGNYQYVYDGNRNFEYQKAMRFESHNNEKSQPPAVGYVAPNPLPTKYWTRLPMFGLNVVDNVIKNVQGGIIISTADQAGFDTATATSGRVYMSGYVANNRFLGYDSSTSTSATPSMNTQTILTVGNRSTKKDAVTSNEVISYGSANLSGNVVSLNSGGGTNGFLPNSGSGYNLSYFADPFAIRLSMTNNWVDTNSANKRFEYISAVINNDPKVLTDSDSISSLTLLPSHPVYQYLLDDISPWTTFTGSATWTSYSTPNGYNSSHSAVNVSNSLTSVTATATWTFDNMEPGQYEVWTTWEQGSDRATDAPYTVYDGAKALRTVRLDQTKTPDYYDSSLTDGLGNRGWSQVGGSYQISGKTLIVTLTNNATGGTSKKVVADGVRIRRIADTIVDDMGTGYSTTGSWLNYSGLNENGVMRDHSAIATVGTTSTATATATWTFNNITAGEYEVWVTWVPSNNRASDAPFTINDGTTTLGTLRMDQTKSINSENSGIYEDFDGALWRKLGSRYAINKDYMSVVLANNAETGKYVVADAVRIKRVADTVANERDGNFSATNVTGNYYTGWQLFSFNSDGYRHGYSGTMASGNPNSATATAKWTFDNLLPGQYEIWATWPGGSSRTAKAPIKVYDGITQRYSTTLNQSISPGSYSGSESYGDQSWAKLNGIANIIGSSLVVEIANNTDETNKTVIADGIRIKRVTTLLIDDRDLGFSTTTTSSGTLDYWSPSSNNKGHDDDHTTIKKTISGTSSVGYAEWQFTGLASGTYDVYVTWVEADNRATVVNYYANGSTTLGNLNQKLAPGSYSGNISLNSKNFAKLTTYATPVNGVLTIKMDTNSSGLNAYYVADAVYIRPTSLLKAQSNSAESTGTGEALNTEISATMIGAAIERWAAAGIPIDQIERLRHTPVSVSDMEAGTLGSADGDKVLIDFDGNGLGWFIDPTPNEDSEFRFGLMVNPKGFDLLTVLEHEFGHILGFDDLPNASYPADLMADTILPGVRKNAADSIYSPTPIGSRLFDPLASVSSSLALVPTANPGLTATAPFRARSGIFSTPMVLNPTLEQLSTMTVIAPQANRDASLFLDASKLGARKFYPKRVASRRPL